MSLFWFRDSEYLRGARTVALDTSAAAYSLASSPLRAVEATDDYLQSRQSLREENARLRQENLVLKGRTQRLAAVLAENTRYKALLNSTAMLEGDVMVAEVIATAADPARHILVLDKGESQGVREGQPLLGADGLMGQIVQLGESTSRALLVTDAIHAVPVQVLRNGVRGIAEGTGDIDRLIVRHVATTTDIVVGDTLVTSGLGGRFPPGYPVAEVTAITAEPGAAFLTVTSRPMAQLDRGRHVMLVVDKPTIAASADR